MRIFTLSSMLVWAGCAAIPPTNWSAQHGVPESLHPPTPAAAEHLPSECEPTTGLVRHARPQIVAWCLFDRVETHGGPMGRSALLLSTDQDELVRVNSSEELAALAIIGSEAEALGYLFAHAVFDRLGGVLVNVGDRVARMAESYRLEDLTEVPEFSVTEDGTGYRIVWPGLRADAVGTSLLAFTFQVGRDGTVRLVEERVLSRGPPAPLGAAAPARSRPSSSTNGLDERSAAGDPRWPRTITR